MKISLLSLTVLIGGYLVLFITAGALLNIALNLLDHRWRKPALAHMWRKRLLRGCLGLLATGVCFSFFFGSVFLRFSCVEVASDRIILSYFWPKPSHAIPLGDIISIKMEFDSKKRGELVVISKDREDRSIVCLKDTNLEQAHNVIQAVLQNKH